MKINILGSKKKNHSVNIYSLLGQGTYGKVYRSDKNTALKVIKANKFGYNEVTELNNLKIIDHPHIIKLIDYIFLEIDGDKFLGMYLPFALYDMEKACKNRENIIYLDKWVYEIISAMHFLHKNGFYHCDMKVENVLVLQDHRSVISDLGLMRKGNVPSQDLCQSYQSPQLSYRDNNKFRFLAGKCCDNHLLKVFKEDTNAFQDDIWALGVTLYDMVTILYSIKDPILWHVSEHIILYCFEYSYGVNVFKQTRIEDKYINILTKLLNPYSENRSMNLLELLNTSSCLFGKTDYIHGKLNNQIENSHPVTDTDNFFKSSMQDIILKILTDKTMLVNDYLQYDYFIPHIIIQCIDLYFRCYNFMVDKSYDKDVDIFLQAIYSVVLSATKLDIFRGDMNYLPDNVIEKLLLFQQEIIEHVDGIVLRDTVADYISDREKIKFINWISSNLNRYEQLSITNMVRLIQEFQM